MNMDQGELLLLRFRYDLQVRTTKALTKIIPLFLVNNYHNLFEHTNIYGFIRAHHLQNVEQRQNIIFETPLDSNLF